MVIPPPSAMVMATSPSVESFVAVCKYVPMVKSPLVVTPPPSAMVIATSPSVSSIVAVCKDVPMVKLPLVYNNVLLRNWRPFSKLGIGLTYSPQKWHRFTMLDFPVSMDGYSFATTPNDPIMLHMNRPVAGDGKTPEEQSRNGRYELLGKDFTAFEKDIREHLSGMLSETDFDPGRDIAGITVNRWPHGYAYGHDPDSGQVAWMLDELPPERSPWIAARKPYGRIAIANSDATADAMTEGAFNAAQIAVDALLDT